MYCFWCLSLCAGRRLSSHNSIEAFGSHCTIVVIDVQDNVLRFFAIDHVLVSFVTIATTGTIFSLQFTQNRLVAGLRPDTPGELERSPDPLAAKAGAYF